MLTTIWQSLAVNRDFSRRSRAVCSANFIDRNAQFEVKDCQTMGSTPSAELAEYKCESRLFFLFQRHALLTKPANPCSRPGPIANDFGIHQI